MLYDGSECADCVWLPTCSTHNRPRDEMATAAEEAILRPAHGAEDYAHAIRVVADTVESVAMKSFLRGDK